MSQLYNPSPAQIAMVTGVARTQRHQLIGGMGTGKTGALLLHANSLQFQYGSFPGMFVLAPSLVCKSWAREIPHWLPHARVCLLLGSTEQKVKALQAGGDIYLMNYEALDWLDKYMAGSWGQLGKLMVCDESTRVKNVRSHWRQSSLGNWFLKNAGGVKMNALANHVHDFPHWVNATGTISPNGMQDLWGQYWWIDGGRALGNSYSTFESRFFYNSAPARSDYPKLAPFPGAMEEVVKLVAPYTTTVRTEDYYDVGKPFASAREVVLPTAAMREYRKMKNQLTAEIQDGLNTRSITVDSAGAKVKKLLQMASGFVYARDEDDINEERAASAYVLHDAKVQAVESLLEESGEAWVLVYYHSACAVALKKKFKDRIAFIDDANFDDTMRKWDSGQIPLLAFQYSKGAYGLSLQHGGRNIVFFEPTYISDHYEQAIERIGPMRQAQSGYARTVNVVDMIAADTEDARVFDVAKGKISLQDAITLMMRDAGLAL